MKAIGVLIGVVLLAFAGASLIRAHYVEEHETKTQLLWNDHEAVVLSGIRRDGWTGSYAGLAVELLRGAFGAIPRYDTNTQWVVVTHITPSGVRAYTEHGTSFFNPQPFEGALFLSGDPTLKWNGAGLVPISAAEQAKFQVRTRPSTPDYSNVEGWSSKMNLLNQEALRSETPVNFGETRALVVAERSADGIHKTITVRFGDGRSVGVVAVNESPRVVGPAEYASLMKPQ